LKNAPGSYSLFIHTTYQSMHLQSNQSQKVHRVKAAIPSLYNSCLWEVNRARDLWLLEHSARHSASR